MWPRQFQLLAHSQPLQLSFISNKLHFKTPQHPSLLRGRAWMDELLSGHPERMKNKPGISQEGFVFVYLEQLLIEKGGLQSSRFMDSTGRLGIFLYAVVTDLSMWKL